MIALNEPTRLAGVERLKDYSVAEAGNVLMICKREEEERIKQFIADALMKYGKDFK